MSRKKFNSARSSAPGATAVARESSPETSTTLPAPAAATTRPATGGNMGTNYLESKERFWLELMVVRGSHLLGSLQVAVVSLTLFAIVLAVGTMVESWYSDKLAKELVYRAWWFNLLLLVLAVNIFFAAAKKWPWKKYQTGFLITHVGLITMVTGGLLTGLAGTDTSMALVDDDEPTRQREIGVPQANSVVTDRQYTNIRVKHGKDSKDGILTFPFDPGSLYWGNDENFHPSENGMLAVLKFLAHPLPHSWQADLGGGATIEVLASYPNVRQERFRPASAESEKTFSAVKISLSTPRMPGMMPSEWVASNLRDSSAPISGIAVVNMLGRCPDDMLEEFRHPPLESEAGQKGVLVIKLGGQVHRLSIAKNVDESPVPLGNTGWKARIIRYLPSINNERANRGDDTDTGPSNPMVEFELSAADGKSAGFGVLGLIPGKIFPHDEHKLEGSLADLKTMSIWYNAPDQRFGKKNLRAVLQFATSSAGKLYYRSFNSSKGSFNFETAGEAAEGKKTYPVWGGMNWNFRVVHFLPEAVAEPWFIPEDLRPGFEDQEGRIKPALRCRLRTGKDSKEFWLGRTEDTFRRVSVGGEDFEVGYNDERSNLGFQIKLLRAEQTVDPGTMQPATYSSYVKLTDQEKQIDGEDRVVTMNQPLEHRGYKFFQSGLNPIRFDRFQNAPESLKPINVSIFTVSRDPGLWLKYIGSSMLALGITCMFYMKAYFFKPRSKRGPAAAPISNGSPK